MATNKWYAKTRTKFDPGGNGGNRCQRGKSVSVHRYCGSRSLPVASASSVSPAVVAVHHAKSCFDTGFSRHAKSCFVTVQSPTWHPLCLDGPGFRFDRRVP